MFFFGCGLMFSWPSAWEHVNVGRNTTSVELARKTLADLHCKFFGNTKQKIFLYRKKILSASVFKKNCAMSAEKYQSWLYNDRCQVWFFQFNPWIIFGYCPIGNVRSASSADAFYFRHQSVIFPGWHRLSFFLSISVNNIFLSSCANVFLAE